MKDSEFIDLMMWAFGEFWPGMDAKAMCQAWSRRHANVPTLQPYGLADHPVGHMYIMAQVMELRSKMVAPKEESTPIATENLKGPAEKTKKLKKDKK